jgi:hypothetical protein
VSGFDELHTSVPRESKNVFLILFLKPEAESLHMLVFSVSLELHTERLKVFVPCTAASHWVSCSMSFLYFFIFHVSSRGGGVFMRVYLCPAHA